MYARPLERLKRVNPVLPRRLSATMRNAVDVAPRRISLVGDLDDPSVYVSSASSDLQPLQVMTPCLDVTGLSEMPRSPRAEPRTPSVTQTWKNRSSYVDPNGPWDDAFNGIIGSSREFGFASNMFDLGNDINFVLTDPDIDFLASLPKLPSYDRVNTPPSPSASLASRLGQATSDAVVEAFKQSAGRWDPEKHHYRAVALESSLSLGTTKIDGVGRFDPHIFNEDLSINIRDQILGVIARSCEQDNLVHVISAFPGVEVLDRLLKAFLTWHVAQTESWIHLPTMSLKEARIELLMACIASAAAISPSRPVQKFGLAIQEFLVFHLWQMSEKANTLIRDLQFLQAFMLHLQIGTWSGIRRKMEMCSSFLGILSNSLRGGDRYRYASYTGLVPHPDDEGSVLESKWKIWVREESFKRLVHCVYIYSSQETLLTSGTPPIFYSELSLPLPQARRLWFARSATEWKTAFLDMQLDERGRSPCIIDLLSDPTRMGSLSTLYDRGLAEVAFLYACSSLIRRYRQDQTVFLSNGNANNRERVLSDEMQHRGILQILNDARSNRERDNEHTAPESDLILEVLFMHLFASLDQMELVAGKDGPEEARLAYPSLHRWIQTSGARQAVWHAGQVLNALRKLPPEQLSNFCAVVAYHASLCIWIYGVVSQDGNDSASAKSTPPSSDQLPEVLIDGEESIETLRWISQNRGVPVITDDSEPHTAGRRLKNIPITRSGELTDVVLSTVMVKFSWKNSVLVENICRLLHALGKTSKGVE
ncbi:uncharacterized protein Z518_00642 [Rhinocladiella mackenziei CBS 650.93]|uniref:Xylanolytic transcriptional activator regulatory domain-containing protein n=1 Tax=Rhinocladiella mackenziei CBS 650.93 TaxID=1442369 RepID=A0A0D2G4G2_9EURO|nr:uncharacterized protein Z518_00642 [Rhinocladiella mackenziei CBS 650.93]KIX09562.1 hypothetical protein Z518_00642 [Rhinocladiella mackenziei CBS 650.93]